MARELGSTAETAAAVHIHPETLRRHYRAGLITAYKVGRLLRFDIDEVRDAFRTTAGVSGRRRAPVGPDFEALDDER